MADLNISNSKTLYPIQNIALLEQLFPGWVLAIFKYVEEVQPRFMTRNSAEFWGMTDEEITQKTCHDIHSLIHPDDKDSFLRCQERAEELQKPLNSSEIFQFRFVIHYRIRRGNEYRHVREEKLYFLGEDGQPVFCVLYQDAAADLVSERVQLTWYRIQSLGYQRVGSYVPSTAEQELTSREIEIINLIKTGHSSKEIADKLCISIHTVRNHRSNLFRKTQSRNMVDLVNNIGSKLN